MYFCPHRLIGLCYSTVCAAGLKVRHCSDQSLKQFQKGALKQAQVPTVRQLQV